MAEEKKRWRPSLGAYRAQESELTVLRERVRVLEKECSDITKRLKQLRCENATLEKSNDMMDKELTAVRHENGKLKDRVEFLDEEVKRLMDRGLFARVFNVY